MTTTVAIHQPNYLPWPGYFHKMMESDVFVFLDDAEFSSDSVIYRNKIKTNDGWTWLTVPTTGPSSNPINSVPIATSERWQKTHRKSIDVHYSNAAHYQTIEPLLDLYDRKWKKLVELNTAFITEIVDILGIDTEIRYASDLNHEGKKAERLVDICESVGGDVYFSGEGARGYQDASLFERAGIDLVYQSFQYPTYEQQFGEFIPNLSIIDMLANIGWEQSIELLQQN
jgi:hypothetical protein